MKNFLISFIVAVMFILPNVAQADTLDDFKNVLANKHFFVKYKVNQHSSDNTSNPSTNYDFSDAKYIEVYNGNDFYIEQNDSLIRSKIGNKLFYFTKHERKGKIYYFSSYHNANGADVSKCAFYYEVAEEIDFDKYKKLLALPLNNDVSPDLKLSIIMQQTDLFDAISAFFSTRCCW